METKPDQSTDSSAVEDASAVDSATSTVEEVAPPTVEKPIAKPKKATPKKKPAAKKKPVEPTPAPLPLTLEELKQQGKEAKQELVSAVIEPALEAVGSLSQTVRDTIAGAFSGLLSRKRRND